jgi:hypothetical protein
MTQLRKASILAAEGLTRRGFVAAGTAGSVAILTGSLRPAFAADKPKVGLVMKSLANEFFKQMEAGAEKYAAANADKFEFKAVGMKDERDFAAQVDAIENFVTQRYDIIVVAPADSKAMVTPIAKAVKDGVKVINIDVELDKDAKKAAGVDLAFFGPTTAPGRSWPATRSPRSSGLAARSSFSRATPRPTTPCSASWASWIRSRKASCNCSTARLRIGRPRRPTR